MWAMRNMFSTRGVRRALALVLLSITTVITIGAASAPAYAWDPAADGWHRCWIPPHGWMWCKDYN
jgi:hypothetical protein